MQRILTLAENWFSHHDIGLEGSYLTSLAAMSKMKAIRLCDLLLHDGDVGDVFLIAQSVEKIVAPVR